MDAKDFKHLRDLVRGRHNPAEHDWGGGGRRAETARQPAKSAKGTPRKKTK